MTSKTVIVILIPVALVATLVSLLHPRASNSIESTAHKIELPASSPYPPLSAPIGNELKMRATEGFTDADQEAIKTIKNGLHQVENEDVESRDRRARSGNTAMESFLKKWTPIGKTAVDVKALFGKPQRESDNFLLYSFDTGNYAWNYQFDVRNGSVMQLTRPLSE